MWESKKSLRNQISLLAEQVSDLISENRKLKSDLQILTLIDYMKKACKEDPNNIGQSCSIQPIELFGERRYIGYVMYAGSINSFRKSRVYTLEGYLSAPTMVYRIDRRNHRIYSAHLDFEYSDETERALRKLPEFSSCIHMSACETNENYRNAGVASEGIHAIKLLADRLRCDYITCMRAAYEGTPDAEECLKTFYEHHGFKSYDENNETYIRYDMSEYVNIEPKEIKKMIDDANKEIEN